MKTKGRRRKMDAEWRRRTIEDIKEEKYKLAK
jgi:hypothetical protein